MTNLKPLLACFLLLSSYISLIAKETVICYDDFSKYNQSQDLQKFWNQENFQNLKLKKSNKKSQMQLYSNGQSAVRAFPIEFIPGEAVELEVALKVNKNTEARVLFSSKNIDWMNYQGGIILKSGSYPMICDKGVWRNATHQIINANKAYQIKMIFYPSYSGESRYDIYLNNQKLGTKLQLRDDLRQDIMKNFGVICLGNDTLGLDLLLDEIKIKKGDTYKMNKKDTIKVSTEAIPFNGRRYFDNQLKMSFDFAGSFRDIENFRVELTPNHWNHADQDDKTKPLVSKFNRAANPTEEVNFEDVPFGMYTIRVIATLDKKEEVLYEDLVSVVHSDVPQNTSPDWGVISHADRFDRNIALELDNIKQAGASWTRMEFILAEIYKDGKFDFSHHNALYEAGKKRNIEFFGLLNTTPAGCSIQVGDGYWAQPNLDKWREICRAVMSEFKGKINRWEIWNEPDGFAFWGFSPGIDRAEHHAKMLSIAAEVAGEISPKIKVMGPSVTATGQVYFLNVLNAGGFDKVDTVTFHFPAGRSAGEWHRKATKILKQRYPAKQMNFWISECEFYLQNMIAMMIEENPLPRFLYTIRDKGVERNVFEHENGMCKFNGQPKDKFISYQYMAKTLFNSQVIGRILLANHVEGYLFKNKDSGENLAVIWTPGILPIEKLPADLFKNSQLFDHLGNPIVAQNGLVATGVRVEHENSVIFVRSIPQESVLLLDGSVDCINDYQELKAGKTTRLKFKFTNLFTNSQKYTLQLQKNSLLSLENQQLEVELASGASKVIEIEIKVPVNANVEDIYINGSLQDINGNLIDKKFGPFYVDNESFFKTQIIYQATDKNSWILPENCRDIHGDYIFENRAKFDQHKHSKGSKCKFVDEKDNQGLQLIYNWQRPKTGWNWMSRRYAPTENIELSGIPVEFQMDIRLQNTSNEELLPLTVLLVFEDATGKELLFEGGGELYWFENNFRTWKCIIPSKFGNGFIHSAYGGNNQKNITAYPLKFKGIILNLVPAQFVWQFNDARPSVNGAVTVNNIKIKYFDNEQSSK